MRKIKTPSKKVIILFLVTLTITGSTLFVLEKKGVIDLYSTDNNASDTDPPLPENYINLDPPTDDEKQAGDQQKETNQETEEQRNTPQPAGKVANVIITDAGQYDNIIEVRSFIQNHYENGTCTITFTKGNLKVTKDTPAYRDASTTVCTNPLFKRSEFSATGEWKVTVTYKAPGASGSASRTITIK